VPLLVENLNFTNVYFYLVSTYLRGMSGDTVMVFLSVSEVVQCQPVAVFAGGSPALLMLLQVASHLMVGMCPPSASAAAHPTSKVKRTVVTRVCDAVKAIAVCHNVTPVYEGGSDASESSEQSDTEVDQQSQQRVSYQASSPDEVNSYVTMLLSMDFRCHLWSTGLYLH